MSGDVNRSDYNGITDTDGLDRATSESAPAPGLCCRCRKQLCQHDNKFYIYSEGIEWKACNKCALILGILIKNGMNDKPGTAA
jgi:hypothetical protein